MDGSLLSWLKTDLGISAAEYDNRLLQYLQVASDMITREGVTLTSSFEDSQLVVMYASWLWRKRDSGEGMPRMLRYQLNNRIFSEKMRAGD